jgi:hypothetical protein
LIELKAEIAPCRLAIIEIKMAWSVGKRKALSVSTVEKIFLFDS